MEKIYNCFVFMKFSVSCDSLSIFIISVPGEEKQNWTTRDPSALFRSASNLCRTEEFSNRLLLQDSLHNFNFTVWFIFRFSQQTQKCKYWTVLLRVQSLVSGVVPVCSSIVCSFYQRYLYSQSSLTLHYWHIAQPSSP